MVEKNLDKEQNLNAGPKGKIMAEARDKLNSSLNLDKLKEISEIEMGKKQLADAILVLLGEKPSTKLDIYKWNEDPSSIKEKMEKTGLIVKEKDLKSHEKEKIAAKLVIAQSEDIANQLLKVRSDENPREYGLLMGYPESAVDAFMGKAASLKQEDYLSMKGIVFSFRLSKNSHEEEFKTLKQWSNALKRSAPDLYNELNENNEIFEKENLLEKLKKEIDAGGLKNKNWKEIRQQFGIKLRKAGDKDLILSILGKSTLIEYFKSLSGPGKPYKLPIPIESDDLSEYLDYELSETPGTLIMDLLKNPLSKAGVNIFISHCIHIPTFTASVTDNFTKEKLDALLGEIISNHPSATGLLSKIFDQKRIEYLKELCEYNEKNPAPFELVNRIDNFEHELFGESE